MRYHLIDISFFFASSYSRQHPYLPALPNPEGSSLSALRAMAAFPQNMLNPKRTVTELKELRALTEDENGAQRVAFTETWSRARAWLREKLQSLPRNLESRPRLASRKAAIIASRDSPRPCRQCLGHTQRKIRAITFDRWSH